MLGNTARRRPAPARHCQKMANKYEVEFTGDARLAQPMVNVAARREGVQLQMSPRRPF